MEILQNANNKDLFIPELDDERKLKTADPVASDLLGALLSVSYFIKENEENNYFCSKKKEEKLSLESNTLLQYPDAKSK